ncbi:glycoside hydrolase family 15 protein [Nonomuraea sp. NPDC051191]|uniref:glycoside hydrolase family 15 protein n=1 Tax=Nonomuraea sp. NPDC051191 TaxID=3364372 RepID=UPI0037962C46
MSARPIGDYAMLSDCRSAALVTSDGSVDWLCLPRFDSLAIFARLLDEEAGCWTIRPACPAEVTRRYVEDTLVLETTFRTREGTLVLLDALTLRAGQNVGQAWAPDPPRRTSWAVARRIRDTVAGWRSWSRGHADYEGPWRRHVNHSGRVLRAMTYAPTGAMVAAVTTSLPESIGGERNWDYRYTWVRDASFTLHALNTATCEEEETAFFTFLSRVCATQVDAGPDLQIMYGIGGERDLSERRPSHLWGWRDSAPVRVGNDAWRQRQLDVYGELLDAAHQTYRDIGPFDPLTRSLLIGVAETAARRRQEPDQSLWEVRGSSRHFTHSKLMCWVGLDRAIALAPVLGAASRVADWTRVRDEIHAAILTRGWNEQAGAFTQTFETAASCADDVGLLSEEADG